MRRTITIELHEYAVQYTRLNGEVHTKTTWADNPLYAVMEVRARLKQMYGNAPNRVLVSRVGSHIGTDEILEVSISLQGRKVEMIQRKEIC